MTQYRYCKARTIASNSSKDRCPTKLNMPATAESHALEPFEETLEPIKEGQAGVQDEAGTSLTRSRPRSDSAISLAEKAISLPRGHSSQLLATQQQDIDLVDSIKLTWERDVERQIREKYAASDHTPFLVGLVGIPGSGKSTSSSILQDMLATESMIDGEEEDAIPNIVIPMDGYHYSIADLQNMDNPEDKIYRRGAPDTFDAAGLKRDLGRIRNGDEEVVTMPGFDHAKGDPEPDAHTFRRREHKIVICEGLYLVHDDHGWEGINSLFDMTIFISSDVDTCIDRLKIRNKCIPGYTPEEIEFRCDAVDRVNANTVMRSINHADVVVKSAAALVPTTELGLGNAVDDDDDDDDDDEAVAF